MDISRSNLWLSITTLTCFIGGSTFASAQDGTRPTTEKWRPKNGIYASIGKTFAEQCDNLGDFSVELGEKNITGDEWTCDVTRITDTGPGAIRLDLSCSDENLSAEIPNHPADPAEPLFKETMTFRKIDEKSLLIRKSQNGKFNFPETQVAYCAPKAQRAYLESKAKEKAATTKSPAPEPAKW